MNQAYACTTGSVLHLYDANTGAPIVNVAMVAANYMAAVSPDGNWLATVDGNTKVQFLHVLDNLRSTPVTTGLTNVWGLAWAPDSSKVYVQGSAGVQSCTPAGTLGTLWTVVGAGTTDGGIPGYPNTGNMAISPDGTKLYCTCGNSVKQVDTTTGTTTATYVIGVGTYGICVAPSGATVYVASVATGQVWPITVAGGTVGTAALTGTSDSEGLCISPDGSTVWAVSNDSGVVTAIATSTMTVARIIGGIDDGYEIAMARDGTTMWVTRPIHSDAIQIDTATGIPSSPISTGVGTYPIGIAIGVFPTPAAHIVIGPLTVTAGGTVSGTPGGGGTGGTVTAASASVGLGPLVLFAYQTSAALNLGPLVIVAVSGRIGPKLHPVPGYRGRWRLTLHTRKFAPATLASTIIAELPDARGRRVDQQWNQPAQATFTLDGHSQSAALIQELLQEVVFWRWDDQTGLEQPVFRGPITQSEDQITTESHTTTYTCHDYSAVLSRRLLTGTYTVTSRDQDDIVADLLQQASITRTSSGAALTPASFLPLSLFTAFPNSTLRGLSGRLRDRTYYGSQNVFDAFDALSKAVSGFDWDVRPSATDTTDSLRVFYPAQGVSRTGLALQYGSTVAGVTRSVNSADYSTYVRVLGNNTSASPTPQFYAEDWTASAASSPAGLWMTADDAADATVQAQLNDKATGDLALDEILLPHYTLTLSPDAYTWGNPNMGDNVPLVIQSGRLNVNTTVRVLGISYDIGDDGQEDVTLVVGRPRQTLKQLLTSPDRNIKALARR